MKIFFYLIVIFLAPFLLFLNFRLLVFNQDYYRSEFKKLDVYKNFSSPQEANNQTQSLIRYLCCDENLDNKLFTDREILHLRDVKRLISLTQGYLFLTAILLAFSIAVLAYKKKTEFILTSFKWGSLVTVSAILFLWLMSLVNFDLIFLNFHLIAFDNDLWQLSPESNLIKLFPGQFFADFADRIALQTVLMSLAIFISSYFLRRKICFQESLI